MISRRQFMKISKEHVWIYPQWKQDFPTAYWFALTLLRERGGGEAVEGTERSCVSCL